MVLIQQYEVKPFKVAGNERHLTTVVGPGCQSIICGRADDEPVKLGPQGPLKFGIGQATIKIVDQAKGDDQKQV